MDEPSPELIESPLGIGPGGAVEWAGWPFDRRAGAHAAGWLLAWLVGFVLLATAVVRPHRGVSGAMVVAASLAALPFTLRPFTRRWPCRLRARGDGVWVHSGRTPGWQRHDWLELELSIGRDPRRLVLDRMVIPLNADVTGIRIEYVADQVAERHARAVAAEGERTRDVPDAALSRLDDAEPGLDRGLSRVERDDG